MILQIKNIEISFDCKTLFSNITMKVENGEKIGLIGPNGAGKTTLFKILTGELAQDSGTVIKNKRKSIGYLKQSDSVDESKTILEEMLTAFPHLVSTENELRNLESLMGSAGAISCENSMNELLTTYHKKMDFYILNGGNEYKGKINYVLAGMGFSSIPLDMMISNLSGGQKTKLALAKILLTEHDLLLLDEPTNHLDFKTLNWLEEYIKSYKGAVLLISHDRYFLDSFVDTICEIEHGCLIRYKGNYSKFLETKSKNAELYKKKYIAQQALIKKMELFVQQNIASAKKSTMAKSRRNTLERLERLAPPKGSRKKFDLNFETDRKSHYDVLSLRDCTICVGDEFDRIPLVDSLDMKLTRGEKLAIIGPNGIGKSTLLKTIMGDNNLDIGSLNFGRDVTVGYCDQEHQKLNPQNTIFHELRDDFPKISQTQIRKTLGYFLFTQDDAFKIIGNLSGGEKSRVSLAKLMLKKVNLLVLDEPTNHLDLPCKELLEKSLRNYPGTIIFVSHDRYFINKVATRVAELSPEGAISFDGNYDYYLSKVTS